MTRLFWMACGLAAIFAVPIHAQPASAASCFDYPGVDETAQMKINQHVLDALRANGLGELLDPPTYCFNYELPEDAGGFETGETITIGVIEPLSETAMLVGFAPPDVMIDDVGFALGATDPEPGARFVYARPAAAPWRCRDKPRRFVKVDTEYAPVTLNACALPKNTGWGTVQIDVLIDGAVVETQCLPCLNEATNIVRLIGVQYHARFCNGVINVATCWKELGVPPTPK